MWLHCWLAWTLLKSQSGDETPVERVCEDMYAMLVNVQWMV